MQQNKTFADKAVQYFCRLRVPENLPDTVEIMNPYASPEVKDAVRQFYNKYYQDERKRIFIMGINPGRFGGGLTGISFTDPVALKLSCGIENSFSNKKELSSEFIYQVIQEYGGTDKFFSAFYLSALYPLAIIKNGKNYNYYDDPATYKFFQEHIRESLKRQVTFGADENYAICLGVKNLKYLSTINEEMGLFKKIIVLDHPRYIMQYRRKKLREYISKYVDVYNSITK